jgi:hypothetical protein
MRSGHALAQHLQVLQTGKSLDAPWHDAPIGAVGILQPKSSELFAGVDKADAKRVEEVVRTAEFWIALLEGEKADLAEEVAKYKQRHQLVVRQADTQAKALREAKIENERLEKELKWLHESRDQAIGDRALAREDAKKLQQSQEDRNRSELDIEDVTQRSQAMEAELEKEREEKNKLEELIVRLAKEKLELTEATALCDTMKLLIKYYEAQLDALDPNFIPEDLNRFGRPQEQSQPRECEVERNVSGHEEDETPQPGKKDKFKKYTGIGKLQDFFRKGLLHKEAAQREPSPSVDEEVNAEGLPSVGGDEDVSAANDGVPKPLWMRRNEVL